MPNARKAEIDRNYDFLQRNLGGFLRTNNGQYALLKGAQVVGFYDAVGDAYRAGLALFPDNIFSIQQITDEPVEMGMMSIAVA